MAQAEEQIVRRLLMAIEEDAAASQRKLSSDIGVALGSVNWYLKRCVKKGLVKLKQAPVHRYSYYLTSKGLEEKARLTASFLQWSLELYRRGRSECAEFFRDSATAGKPFILLAGDGDLAEIAVLSSFETGAKVVAVIDPAATRSSCAGVPIAPALAPALAAINGAGCAILLTDLRGPKGSYARVVKEAEDAGIGSDAVHVPRILNFKPWV